MDFNGTTPFDQLTEKWSPVLDHGEIPQIQDNYRRKVTAALLENQETALKEASLNESAPLNNVGEFGLGGLNNTQKPMAG